MYVLCVCQQISAVFVLLYIDASAQCADRAVALFCLVCIASVDWVRRSLFIAVNICLSASIYSVYLLLS